MSYILNALRKSEQDRQDNQVETLENRIQSKLDIAPKKTSPWMIVLVLVNLIFLSYFIWSFTKESDDVSEEEVVVSEQKQTIKVEPVIKTERKGSVLPSPDIESAKALRQGSIAEQIKKRRAKPLPVVKQAKSSIKLAPPVVKPKAEPIKQVQPLRRAKKKHPETVVEETNDYPFLSELDYNFRRKVPNIDINVYVYAEKQEDRFIMTGMKKYQAGESIGSGITLKEIRIKSLVVKYKNKVFQLKRK